jgi:DNA-binding NtrC family response regulator
MPITRLPGDDKPAPPDVQRADTTVEIDRSIPFRLAKERAIEKFERAYIGPLLEDCEGNMSKAARTARMDRMYLHQLAQKYGYRISRRTSKDGDDE